MDGNVFYVLQSITVISLKCSNCPKFGNRELIKVISSCPFKDSVIIYNFLMIPLDMNSPVCAHPVADLELAICPKSSVTF